MSAFRALGGFVAGACGLLTGGWVLYTLMIDAFETPAVARYWRLVVALVLMVIFLCIGAMFQEGDHDD